MMEMGGGTKRDSDADYRILSTQNRILDLIAKRSPLQEILDSLCLLVERQSEGGKCSIALVDKDGSRLKASAGPSMSAGYMASLEGLPIAENMGSCGSAVFRREQVICADVAHAPEWAHSLDVADRFDIKASWSTPFSSSTDQVLGSVAISHAYPCAPTPFDYQLLQTASSLAGIATENELFETELVKDQRLESVGLLAGGDHGEYRTRRPARPARKRGAQTAVLGQDGVGSCTGDHAAVAHVRLWSCSRHGS